MRTPTSAIFDRLKSQPAASTTTRLNFQLSTPSLTRRDVLRALCAALAMRLRPLATGFTALTDELGRLTCWRGAGLTFAAP